MSETSSKPEPDRANTQPRIRRAYLLVEVMAVVVLVGALLWLMYNYQPRGPIGMALLNHRLWMLILLVSGFGTAGGLIPYYVGQRGTEAVFAHYPKLQGRPWERLEALFQRWGAPSLILSGVPALGAALLVAAGAFGIRKPVFLFWVFLGKVLRYWILAFAILVSLQLLG